jgi:hypothetical protein
MAKDGAITEPLEEFGVPAATVPPAIIVSKSRNSSHQDGARTESFRTMLLCRGLERQNLEPKSFTF